MDHHNWLWVKVGMATATVITFAYTTFETKEHANELINHIIRIEEKLDRIIESRIK